jgi:hypothetical protein
MPHNIPHAGRCQVQTEKSESCSKVNCYNVEQKDHDIPAVKLYTVTVCVNNIQHTTELTVSIFSTAKNRTQYDLAYTGDSST